MRQRIDKNRVKLTLNW